MQEKILPNSQAMCEDYKNYRKNQDEIMSEMTETQQTEHMVKRHSDAQKVAESWGKKPVKLNSDGDENGK